MIEINNKLFEAVINISSPLEVLKGILEQKDVNVDCQRRSGKTPLHDAAWHGDIGKIKLLLAYGANPYFEDDFGNRPMQYAIYNKNDDAKALLLQEMGKPEVSKRKIEDDREKQRLLAEKYKKMGVTPIYGEYGLVRLENTESRIKKAREALDEAIKNR